jgi:glycosyltransferase involved in cell wall biosynthesis
LGYPRGATVCGTACASRRPITPNFPNICGRAIPIPVGWSYGALRWFHGAAVRCMVSTASVRKDLSSRGFENLASWRRGVDTELFKPGAKDFLQLPRPIAAYVGRVAVEKNIDAFLQMPLVRQQNRDRRRTRASATAGRVPSGALPGVSLREDLAKHLAAADVMVFPSRTDTFGLVNLEAMACGVPVAAYPVTGPIDVVEDGITGALDTDLARAAERALGVDPKACRERALRSGWDVCSREFEGNLTACNAGPQRVERSATPPRRPELQPKLILASRLVRESALDSASSSSIRPSRTRL